MTKIKLADGSIIQHGQLFRPALPKRASTYVPPIAHSMKRASTGVMSAYHHGITQEDEPNIPFKSHENPVALHPSTPNPDLRNKWEPHLDPLRRSATDTARGMRVDGEGQRVLIEAGNLSNPNKKGWS
jgi:hypothetical protein